MVNVMLRIFYSNFFNGKNKGALVHCKCVNPLACPELKSEVRTSLVVQLKICLAMQKTQVRSLIRELRSHIPRSSEPEYHN